MKLSLVLAVARFELLRFFKLKDQLVGLVTMLAVGLGAYGVSVVVKRSGAGPVRVAVLGPGAEQIAAEPGSRFEWRVASDSELAGLREQVASRDVDGVLMLGADGSAELLSRRVPAWRGELQALLDERMRRERMVEAGMAPGTLAAIFSPVSLTIATVGSQGAPPPGARLSAIMAVGLMLLGILLGNAYLLVGITGEKQLRVTEQVVAAISPQTWIDGKILGLSGLTLALLALYVVPGLIVMSVLRWFGVGVPAIPAAAGDPLFLLALIAFASLGFLLWFTFFAAIAATVDDPNNSSRGGWLLFPMLPLGLAFAVMRDPDATVARVLGLLPPTAPTVMPVRMLLGEVPLFELLLALAGLVLAIWMLRRTAGRIFELGMLMYGKEPSWREIWRLARETK